MSEYYTVPTPIPPATLARSADVNAISESVDTGFDNLPTDLAGLKSEVEAARDGELTLLVKEQTQDAAIAAVEVIATTGYPDQSGNSGKVLSTDGSVPFWKDSTIFENDTNLAMVQAVALSF